MNITEFKTRVLSLNLNDAEIVRINNLTSRSFKSKIDHKKVTESNYRQIWHQLNKKLAEEDKFHRIQTHSMRNFTKFVDYGHLAYNEVTEDF